MEKSILLGLATGTALFFTVLTVNMWGGDGQLLIPTKDKTLKRFGAVLLTSAVTAAWIVIAETAYSFYRQGII